MPRDAGRNPSLIQSDAASWRHLPLILHNSTQPMTNRCQITRSNQIISHNRRLRTNKIDRCCELPFADSTSKRSGNSYDFLEDILCASVVSDMELGHMSDLATKLFSNGSTERKGIRAYLENNVKFLVLSGQQKNSPQTASILLQQRRG